MHSAADYASWFSPKMRSSFCSWVCLRSDRVLTTNELLQGSFESVRRSRYACLVHFWCAPECDCCILTCPNEPHQEGKRTLVRFNRTKWGGCESTLRLLSIFVSRLRLNKKCLPKWTLVTIHRRIEHSTNTYPLQLQSTWNCIVKWIIHYSVFPFKDVRCFRWRTVRICHCSSHRSVM